MKKDKKKRKPPTPDLVYVTGLPRQEQLSTRTVSYAWIFRSLSDQNYRSSILQSRLLMHNMYYR